MIYNQLWWQMGSSCVTDVEDFENSGHPVFQGMSPLGRGSRIETQSTAMGDCNIDLLYRTVHSSNQLCIYGAVAKWCGRRLRTNSGETSQSRYESARKTPREIQIKQEDFKSMVATASFGKPNDHL